MRNLTRSHIFHEFNYYGDDASYIKLDINYLKKTISRRSKRDGVRELLSPYARSLQAIELGHAHCHIIIVYIRTAASLPG